MREHRVIDLSSTSIRKTTGIASVITSANDSTSDLRICFHFVLQNMSKELKKHENVSHVQTLILQPSHVVMINGHPHHSQSQ